MESKDYYRGQARTFRASLSDSDVSRRSKIMCDGLKSAIDWRIFKNLHCYQAISDNNEPDPDCFISWLKTTHPNVKIYLQDKTGNFPRGKFEVIIVPGLAFDRSGGRLGYGRAMYDRFLSEHPKAIKIGLCYEEQISDKLPQEEHDIAMNLIISEEQLHN